MCLIASLLSETQGPMCLHMRTHKHTILRADMDMQTRDWVEKKTRHAPIYKNTLNTQSFLFCCTSKAVRLHASRSWCASLNSQQGLSASQHSPNPLSNVCPLAGQSAVVYLGSCATSHIRSMDLRPGSARACTHTNTHMHTHTHTRTHTHAHTHMHTHTHTHICQL